MILGERARCVSCARLNTARARSTIRQRSRSSLLNSVRIANLRPSCHKSSRFFFVSSLLCDFPTSHWAQREPQAHGRYAGCSLASEAVASHEQPPQLLNLLRTCYLISPISSISHHLHGFLLFFTLSSRVSVMLHTNL